MADRPDPAQPEPRRRKFWDNPFALGRATVPAYRIRIREKRVLWLVGIALALAGIGALLGARLLHKPRQVRSSVKADVRRLDSRLWETVSCLGGDEARTDGADLAGRILHSALTHPRWPREVSACRRASALLLSTTSAIIASASATPARLTDEIRHRYRAVLRASSALHLAVTAVADDAHAGRRVPAWKRCVAAGRAVSKLQLALGRVERAAAIPRPRALPGSVDRTPPKWPEPAKVSAPLPNAPALRLIRLPRPNAGALLLAADARSPQPLLLLDPLGQARPLRLRSPTTPIPDSLRWLDLATPASSAFKPGLLWAHSAFDPRSGRGSVVVGTTGQHPVISKLGWPRVRGLVARPVAGLVEGKRRALLVTAPRGLRTALTLFRSADEGRTWGKPVDLAVDAANAGVVTVLDAPISGSPLVVYRLADGAIALQRLPAADGPLAPRSVIHSGRAAAPRVCWAGPRALFVATGNGRLWASTDGGLRFRTVSQPAALPTSTPLRIACLKGRVAVVGRRAPQRFDYYTCGPETCSKARRLSWSRVHDVRLVATGDAIQILLAGPRLLFARADRGAVGKLAAPRPVTRWKRPPRSWEVIRGVDPRRLSVLLLYRKLTRLRSADGGRRWQGE